MKARLIACMFATQMVVSAFAVDVFGTVDHTSPSGIALANHEIYVWADAKELRVLLPAEKPGGLSDIKKGDSVRLVLNGRHMVSDVIILPKDPGDLVPIPFEPNWDGWNSGGSYSTIAGRTFPVARNKDLPENVRTISVPVSNVASFDRFEVFVGPHEEANPKNYGSVRFTLLGDDDVLYQSTYLRPGDHSVHIQGNVSKYKSITVQVDHEGKFCRAVIAQPTFFRVPRTVPVLTAPDPDSIIKGDTDLAWEKVDQATGYLIELQCVDCQDAADAGNPSRFISVRVEPDKTSYAFAADKMPRGKWRWRVHSLMGKQIVGEMGMWRSFRA